MPLTLEYVEPLTITVRATGAVTYDEVEEVINVLMTDPHLCCGVCLFADGRMVERAPSTAELRAIARDLKPLLDRGLGPIVILTSSAFVYGICRMFSVFAEAMGATVHVFRSGDEAHDWLEAHTSTAA